MATVTGLTAARMLVIEGASIISARLIGDDLVLTTYGGQDINVGSIRGQAGSNAVVDAELTQQLSDLDQRLSDAAATVLANQQAMDLAFVNYNQAIVTANIALAGLDVTMGEVNAELVTINTDVLAAYNRADLGVTNAGLAQIQATFGVTSAATAQTQADLGVLNAGLASTAAGVADGKAVTAQTTANTAVTNASTAQTAAVAANALATTATTNAATAQTAANTAQGLANTATTDAATAQAAAVSASGLAASKAVVLYQTSAPSAVYQNVNTLWIDITGGANTPKKWVSGSTWAVITDKAAIDAAAAAGLAQTQANTATTNAATAQTAANTAQTQANTATTNAATAQAAAVAAQTKADTAFANAATAQTKADQGVADAATALAKADGKVASYFQTVMPTGQVAGDIGDLWFDTDDNNRMYRYTGSSWVISDDQRVATALTNAATANTAAGTAQSTANSKITTFYQTSSPNATTVGDLWVDTDDGNKLYRASAVGSGSWVSVQDTTIAAASAAASSALTAANTAQTAANTAQATADGAIRTFYQADPPTGLNNTTNVGDLWFDTDNGQAWRWNGTIFVVIADNTIAVALAAAQNAQTTADGKIDAYYQITQPAAGMGTGDLWYDTDDGNKPYYYNGTTWIVVRDTTIATAQTTANTGVTNAATAQTQANTGVTNAATAQTQANLGVTNAGIADGKAVTAQTQANLGVTNAGIADVKAVTATTNAATAQTQANLGITNAGIADGKAVTAQTQANLGVTNAAIAQTAANGKNKVFYSTGVPGATANTLNDIWFQYSAGQVIAQWIGQGGTSWASVIVGSAMIANLDAGKITTGTLSAGRIAADYITAVEIAALTITSAEIAANAITASKILAGEIVAGKLATDSVVAANILAGAIVAGKLAADSVLAVNILAGEITAGKLAADSVIASNLVAGAVTADKIDGVAIDGKVITGAMIRTADTGRRIEFDSSAFNLKEADGTNLVSFPTDPLLPATFEGDVSASTMTIENTLSMGVSNTLEASSSLTLVSNLTAPTLAPTVTFDWPYVSTPTPDGFGHDGIASDSNRVGWVRVGSYYYTVRNAVAAKMSFLERYDLNGVYDSTWYCWVYNIQDATGLTAIGTVIYVYGTYTGSTGWRRVSGWPTNVVNGAQVSSWDFIPASNQRNTGIGNDDIALNGTGNIVLAWTVNSGTYLNKITWRTYNKATGALVTGPASATTATVVSDYSFAGDISGIIVSACDFGATRIIVHKKGSTTAAVFNTTGPWISLEGWYYPTAAVTGVCWDATLGQFICHDPVTSRMYKMTGIKWTIESPIWWVSNTWTDTNATGGTHETTQGPRVSFTMKQRSRLNITIPKYPLPPTVPTSDDVTGANIFLSRNATDPGRTAMEKQNVLVLPTQLLLLSSVTLRTTALVPPSATNTFPLAVPAKITSGLGEWSLSGDGTTLGLPGSLPTLPTRTASTSTTCPSSGVETKDLIMGNYVFTALAGHRYMVMVTNQILTGSVANDRFVAVVRDGENTAVAATETEITPAGANRVSANIMGTWKFGAGSQTLSLYLKRMSGTGTGNFLQPYTGPSREFFVVDMGLV